MLHSRSHFTAYLNDNGASETIKENLFVVPKGTFQFPVTLSIIVFVIDVTLSIKQRGVCDGVCSFVYVITLVNFPDRLGLFICP